MNNNSGMNSYDDRLEQAADWCDRQQELTPQQQTEFVRWLNQDNNLALYQQVSQAMGSPALTGALQELAAKVKAETLSAPHASPSYARKFAITLAASVMLFIPLFLWFSQPPGDSAKEVDVVQSVPLSTSREIRAAVGQPVTETLQDGSHLHLNASSRIKIIKDGKLRRVDLEQGQVFFDVARDESHPFIVNIEDTQVRVLGTSFDVEYLLNTITVTVYSGHVQVMGEQVYDLYKNQQLVLLKNAPAQQKTVSGKHFPDWRSGWLTVDNEPLTAVLARLQRYSSLPLKLQSDRLAEMTISGRFPLDSPDQTVQLLAQAYGFRIEKQPNEIRLLPR